MLMLKDAPKRFSAVNGGRSQKNKIVEAEGRRSPCLTRKGGKITEEREKR